MTLDYSRFYATFHSDDSGHRHGLFLLHQRMLASRLPADRGAPILDVGCGRGYALQDVGKLGYSNLQGIDVNESFVSFARGNGLEVELTSDVVNYLSVRPAKYAVILLMDVLEHIPREFQAELLRAIALSLRPGGRLICSVPNASSAIAGYWFHNDYTHHSSYTDGSLTFLLRECGFASVQCRGIELFPRPRFLFWLPTPRAVAWWLLWIGRAGRRMSLIGELGWERGRALTLTPNLLAVADKAG